MIRGDAYGQRYKKFLSDLLAELQRIDYVRPEDIPNIDLYMDQITTFMDSQLETSKRHADDKILTKTMINNYAKNNLLPPPEKKKYTKRARSDADIHLLFQKYPKHQRHPEHLKSDHGQNYFGKDGSYSLEDIYREVFGLEHQETQNLMKDLARKFNTSCQTFRMLPGGRRASAELQSDLYVKLRCLCQKTIIERLIDTTTSDKSKTEKTK